ncbi:hypothetical protein BGZ95_002964 [Linnemannia exigua]|uniref:Uncharacterized protein n=1 Tax=Linnemannia exigua TaxID=604196 RepID=A0AAD4D5E5_9FUNG|nr:hypothetical protein BGZ95_002964 [Linnemannia exigua]
MTGLEHVRDILLGFTHDLDPLVIESGMLDRSAQLAQDDNNNSATGPPVERTPINATRQDTLQPNAKHSNSPSRSTSDHSIEQRQGLSRNSSQASDLSGFSGGSEHHHHHHQQEYRFNTANGGLTTPPVAAALGAGVVPALMAETYLPAPVPPPPAPKPFSFDDLLGDTTIESTSSRTSSPPSSSRKAGTGLTGSGLASKVKSPRSSLAHSQFSWMLSDSGDDGGIGGNGGAGGGPAAVAAGGGGGGGTRSSMDLFSPGSASRMKIDPLAGSVSRTSGILGGNSGGSHSSAGVGAGGHHTLQDDDPLRT